MAVVVISGTPGTGKTTLATMIAKTAGYRRIDVQSAIRKNNLSEGYDRKRHCEIVDAGRLVQLLVARIHREKSKNIVIDSHLAHYLPPDAVDLCIVTKCDLGELKRRLDKRYPPDKVRENLDAEIFDICQNEAVEFGHKVVVVDTTKGIKVLEIKKLLKVKTGPVRG